MKIRTQYSLMTTALIGLVVGAITLSVARAQRRIMEGESAMRLDAVLEGVTRIASESMANHDELMLVSYLMFLQREHPELAMASLTRREHTTLIGRDRPGLRILSRAVPGAPRPATYTVVVPPGPTGVPSASLQVSSRGVTLEVTGDARVNVEEPGRKAAVVRLGFVPESIEADIDRQLDPLLRRTLALAGSFMFAGILGSLFLSKLLTGPLSDLAAAAAAVGRGNLDVTVAAARDDEVGAVARRFNEMTAGLKELLRFREDILHTLTHELNTPLGGLKAYVELWEDGKLSPERQPEALKTMMAAVLRMESSLAGALGLFRAERRQADARSPDIVWVDKVLREALSLFSPVAQSKAIAMAMDDPRAIGCIVSDEELVRQAATNLVSNALKYTPAGGSVRVGLENAVDSLTFWVRDSGSGILPEDLQRVFSKFDRSGAGEEARGRIPGTGLGLAIAKKAVEAMGGRIWVESEPGRGATFRVRLPKKRPRKAEGA